MIFRIWVDRIVIHLGIFMTYCFMTTLWATDKAVAMKTSSYIVKVVLMTIIVYNIFRDYNRIEDFILAIKIGGYALSVFILLTFGIRKVFQYVSSGIRLFDNSISNVNDLSSFFGVICIIVLYNYLFQKLHAYDIMVIPCIICIIAFVSKAAIAGVFLGVFFLLFFWRKKENKSNMILFVFAIGFLIAIIIAIKMGSNIPVLKRIIAMVNVLLGANNGDSSTFVRKRLIDIGISVFKKHPFFGVGIDNARKYTVGHLGMERYLHCGYIEILANGGIFLATIYYSMWVFPIRRLVRSIQLDNYTILSLVLIIKVLFEEIAASSYIERADYMYLIFVYLCWERLKEIEIIK